jgi:hypothetical protein
MGMGRANNDAVKLPLKVQVVRVFRGAGEKSLIFETRDGMPQ